MWKTESSVISKARASTIWKLYTDLKTWKNWDDSLHTSSLEGDFILGAVGLLHPKGAPDAMPFRITAVEPERSFSNQTELPGARLTFFHRLEPVSDGTRITHLVEITGSAWENYGNTFGRELEQDLPKTVLALSELAQSLE